MIARTIVAAMPPTALLRKLAAAELAVPGRYRLGAARPSPKQLAWWQEVLRWVYDRWTQFWNAAFGRVHIGPRGAIAIGDILIAATVLVLVIVGLRLLSDLRIARRDRVRSSEPLEAVADAATLYRSACEAARGGDYAAASRQLFAASVRALDVRGCVQDERSATVGELRRRLRERETPLVAAFDDVARPFVTTVYAERAVDRHDWERARTAYLTIAPETAS